MELGDQDLHVWSVRLIASDREICAFEKTLSPDEIDRSHRFHQPRHRCSYVVSHGVLRKLLGAYLRIHPEQIEYRFGPAGKPALALAGASLAFNMSHSGELAVYAFARDCQLGTDVEQIRQMPDFEAVASRFFTPQECSELMALEPPERIPAFFRYWTRKEAFIKAVGEGLPLLERFPASRTGSWHTQELAPAEGYIGAVVYDGPPRAIREFSNLPE